MSATLTPTSPEELLRNDEDEPAMRERIALGSTPAALLAECTCPEWCEHDHENE